MRKAIFYIDGGTGYYQGYTKDELWNGWKVPYFTREEMNRVLKSEGIESPYPLEELDCVTIDGQEVYNFANGWVWVDVWFDEDITLNVRDISGRGGVYNTTPLDYACANTQNTDLVQWLENNWTSGEYLNQDMAEAITIVHTPTPINE